MKYVGRSGETIIANDSVGLQFLCSYIKTDGERCNKEKEWEIKLIRSGVKAAHPDDGWNKRKENKIILCYPQFNLGVQVGDIIAIGSYDDYYFVEVTKIEVNLLTYYHYKFMEI